MINPTILIATKAPAGTATPPRAAPVCPLCVGFGALDVCDAPAPDCEFAFEGSADPVGPALPEAEAGEPDTLDDAAGAGAEPAEAPPAPAAGPDPAAALKSTVPLWQAIEPLHPWPGAGVPLHVQSDWVGQSARVASCEWEYAHRLLLRDADGLVRVDAETVGHGHEL